MHWKFKTRDELIMQITHPRASQCFMESRSVWTSSGQTRHIAIFMVKEHCYPHMAMLTREEAFHKLKTGGDGPGPEGLGEMCLWLLSLSEVLL